MEVKKTTIKIPSNRYNEVSFFILFFLIKSHTWSLTHLVSVWDCITELLPTGETNRVLICSHVGALFSNLSFRRHPILCGVAAAVRLNQAACVKLLSYDIATQRGAYRVTDIIPPCS